MGGDHLEGCVYLHEVWPQVQKWAAEKKVRDMDCSFQFVFCSWPLISEGAFCYEVTFIWCGLNYYSWSWNDRNRIWIDTYMSYPCVCGVCLLTWILSLTSKLLIHFECYFQFVSPPGTTWDEIQYLWPQLTNCILTNNSTLPLIIQWQLKPRSHRGFTKYTCIYICWATGRSLD